MQGNEQASRGIEARDMKKMILFQVEEEQHQALTDFAVSHGKSVAAALREMISFFIPAFSEKEIQPIIPQEPLTPPEK
jgi:hypothetical protein